MAELDKNGADMTIEETFAALDDLIGRLAERAPWRMPLRIMRKACGW